LVKGGSLENRYECLEIIHDLIVTHLGIPNKYITYYSGGKVSETHTDLLNISYTAPSHIIIKGDDLIKNDLFVLIKEKTIGFLEDNNMSFNEKEKKITRIKLKKQISKTDMENSVRSFLERLEKRLFEVKIYSRESQFFIKGVGTKNQRKLSFKVEIGIDDFLEVGNILWNNPDNHSFEIEFKPFENVLRKIINAFKFSFGEGSKKEIVSLFQLSYNREGIIIKFFDLINYILMLSEKLKQFFIQSMNLQALLKRQKVTENYKYTSKGWLDVNETIRHTLRRGVINPMRTYREEMLKDPPTLFLIYDSSGSMRKFNRYGQFISLLSLSFFNRRFRTINIGYICSYGLEAEGILKMFPSETKDVSRSIMKKAKYSADKIIGEKYAMKEDHYTASPKINGQRFVGFLINDYRNFKTAMRDFLANPLSASGGTSLEVLNIIPKHPDMSARGLKYVMVFTDHEFYEDDRGLANKMDFLKRSEELIKMTDVRYFYFWMTYSFFKNDDLIGELEEDLIYRFPTKKYLMTRIRDFLIADYEKMEFIKFENLSKHSKAELLYLKFLYQHWENVYIVDPANMIYIGEMRNYISKLEKQEFFIT